jgi:RNA polymerase sigma-70 factor (ECF subfamily)
VRAWGWEEIVFVISMLTALQLRPIYRGAIKLPREHRDGVGKDQVTRDEAFYATFLAPMEARMLRSIWRIVRNPDVAEDTLQDAMATIWRRRNAVRSHPNPPALVLKICVDAAYDSLRKECRLRRTESLQRAYFSSRGHGGESTSIHDRRELEMEIRNAVSELSRNQAVAVIMRVVQDQPYPEVARALGCSETTARIHVMRGRAKLGRRLAHLSPGTGRGKGQT